MKFRILIVLISFALISEAQHAYFSSLNQNLLSINPAFAGTNKQLRAQVILGNTGMPKFGHDKQSYYAGVDFLGKKYSGFGLSFSNDLYGPVLRRTQIDFSYAVHFAIKNKIKIVHAYQLSYFELNLDRTKLNFGYPYQDINDAYSSAFSWAQEIVPSQTKRNLDFSTGLLAYSNKFYAGITILSITQPDEGLLGVSKRPLTQIYNFKYKFFNANKFNFDVYTLAKLQKIIWINKDGYHTRSIRESFLQYGANVNYKNITIHLAHRINEVSDYNAFITGAGLNLKGLRIGYNTKLNYGSQLSNIYFHELFLSFCFGKNKKDSEENSAIRLID